jgi:tetratricopeptide (TPR) repeat protein
MSPGQLRHTAHTIGMWGGFRLVQKVGQGSFGEVYRAFDTTLEREVALKLLLPRVQDNDAAARTLLREARAIARVRHPNVVSVYGVDQHDGRVGFWSDFVQGKTLSAILKADGPFGAREAALMGVDVCKAVSAVHAAGLLHRDIKSGNVMREAGGRILLMDFGLTHDHAASFHQGGTPSYMAPELLKGEAATVCTDIYAVGVLLFHLVTGKYPVEGSDMDAIAAAHAAGARRTVMDLRPDLPEPFTHVIETALHPDSQRRYKSAGQMITALSEGVGLSVASSSVTVVEPAPAAKGYGRWWIRAGVGAAALALATPQIRTMLAPAKQAAPRIAAVQNDYEKAHDWIAHYYRPGALRAAIPLLEQITQQDPNFAPAFSDLAWANVLELRQQRDNQFVEPARLAALRALEINPELASAHVSLGLLYEEVNRLDLATQELDLALKLDKNNAAAYSARGLLLNRQGRSKDAEEAFQRSVSLAPAEWGSLQELAGFYLSIGEMEKARSLYQEAVDLDPQNPRALAAIGGVYRSQGRMADATVALRKALELEPSFLYYRNLGRVLLESGQYKEARPMFEKATELRPDEFRAWGYLATLNRLTGADPVKTAEIYRKAITLGQNSLAQNPNNEYANVAIGTYYAALGNTPTSLRFLKKADALSQGEPALLYELALGYDLLHRRTEALKALGASMRAGTPLLFIQANPQLSTLRADPRFQANIARASTQQLQRTSQ